MLSPSVSVALQYPSSVVFLYAFVGEILADIIAGGVFGISAVLFTVQQFSAACAGSEFVTAF